MFDGSIDYVQIGIWLTAISALAFVAGILLVPWLAVRMPADYLVRHSPQSEYFRRRSAMGWVLFALKNLAGGLIALAGVLMLGTPGPGWGAILVGLALMSFPGKRRLELRLLGSQFVIRSLNAIRARANQPPLEVPPRGRPTE